MNKMLLRVLLGLSLVVPTLAQAVSISACDFNVGDDVTHAAPGASIYYAGHAHESAEITEAPALITESYYPGPSLPCGSKAIGGYTGTLEWYREWHDFGASLTELGAFYGLWIDFAPRVKEFEFTAFSNTGDSIFAFVYGPAGQYLGEYHIGWSTWLGACADEIGDDLACRGYSGKITAYAGPPIASVYFGSWSGAVWINGISYSVPEPSTLGLFALSLVALA